MQRFGELSGEVQGHRQRYALLTHRLERRPGDVFHHDVRGLAGFVLADVVHGDNPRMRQLARRLRLAEKAVQEFLFFLC